jgi:aerobic carbon-monoxide dehydrogenase small subunit
VVTTYFPSPLTGEGWGEGELGFPSPESPPAWGGENSIQENEAMKQIVNFTLNGESVQVEIEPHLTLLQLLREKLELTGTKEGCGMGECGACTVLLNGRTVNSCIFPAMEVDGKSVTTIEGLTDAQGNLHPIQKAFIEYGAIQCGFCTPGMVLSAKALLDENPKPTEEEIRGGIAGNLCRCTGYLQIVQAIKAASGQ